MSSEGSRIKQHSGCTDREQASYPSTNAGEISAKDVLSRRISSENVSAWCETSLCLSGQSPKDISEQNKMPPSDLSRKQATC